MLFNENTVNFYTYIPAIFKSRKIPAELSVTTVASERYPGRSTLKIADVRPSRVIYLSGSLEI
jgi:hypothetical protein